MNADRARVRIALVGAGAMGSLHARVIAQSQDTELSCVVDPDRAAGETLAERFRTRWLPELDGFQNSDAVVVASPTATHLKWGLRALEAERPTLVEKPLADTVDDARLLVETAATHGVPLMCGLLERFNPAVRTAMNIVEDPVHVATVRHSPYVPRIVTGVAQDLLIHDVDLVLRLAGRLPSTVDARFGYPHPSSARGAEDVAEVTCDFDGAILASLSVSRVSQRKVRSLVISELERLIEIDMVRQDITVYRHVLNEALEESPGYRQQTIIDIPAIHDAHEPLVSQLERFVALARGEDDASEELATIVPPHLVVEEVVRVAAGARGASLLET